MKRILIVEGDDGLAVELTEMLREKYLVMTVPTPITAWEMINSGPPFDLMIINASKSS